MRKFWLVIFLKMKFLYLKIISCGTAVAITGKNTLKFIQKKMLDLIKKLIRRFAGSGQTVFPIN